MKRQVSESGVVFTYPDSYRPATRRPPAAVRRARPELEFADLDAVDNQLDAALSDLGFEVADQIVLEAPQGARALRAVPPAEQVVEIEVDTDEGESAAVLVEEDGCYSWVFPYADGGRRGVQRSSPAERETLRFEIPLGASASDRRGLFSWGGIAVNWLKARVLKFAADVAIGGATRILERDVRPGLVVMDGDDTSRWRHVPDFSLVDLSGDDTKPLLLFVHGTFSSTVGSFRGLTQTPWGKELLADMQRRYRAIIGFDHPTLSQTPVENAIELMRMIEAGTWDRAPIFDTVAYSRGGMVARSLIEMVLPSSTLRRRHPTARVDRAVLVAATNAGTQLASPDNWHALIDVYTNIAVAGARLASLAPGAPALTGLLGEAFSSIGSFAKYLATAAIDRRGIPGLAAMDPDGEFARLLNQKQPGQPGSTEIDYRAVISDFEPGARQRGIAGELSGRLLKTVADRIVDQLMGTRNDLVVDTRSMTAVDDPRDDMLREVLDFGTNGSVYHLVYFTQQRTAEALRRWLGLRQAARRRGEAPVDDVFPQFDAEFKAPADLAPERRLPSPREPAVKPRLVVEVVWGDITSAEGDMYAVGHYRGVLPQNAEKALDQAISSVGNSTDEAGSDEEDFVLTNMTRRNLLRGELGDIQLFPSSLGKDNRGIVAVCGMGFPGSFNEGSLRQLHRNLSWTLLTLPGDLTLCTVLIGAGEGNLDEPSALRGLVAGFADTMRGEVSNAAKVRIVEITKGRAARIQRALETMASKGDLPVDLEVVPGPTWGQSGRVEPKFVLELLAGSAAKAKPGATLTEVIRRIPTRERKAPVGQAIKAVVEEYELPDDHTAVPKLAQQLLGGADNGEPPSTERGKGQTVRLSVYGDGARLLAAVIELSGATIPERVIDLDPKILAEAARRMTDPDPREVPDLARLLHGLVLPRDFRPMIEQPGPLVIEVDRSTAPIHWEMLAWRTVQAQVDPSYIPSEDNQIALQRPVSRQLRTTYSPPPSAVGTQRGHRLQALVIGDPGDPDKRHDLAGARREARVVARLFNEMPERFDRVHVMIGAPREDGSGPEPGVAPATRIDVLRLLMNERIDLVHYAGHGDFDDEDPSTSGWLFKDGLLTAREVARLDRVPPMIVANACLTARTSATREGGAELLQQYGEAALLPSLADEFFRRGVLNYIGTAWQIDDQGAIDFAKAFYRHFIDEGATIGDALLEVRTAMRQKVDDYWALWAAYQHYGDPSFRVMDL